MSGTTTRLRHFFIGRDSRSKGYGKLAFAKLLETVGAEQIDIEVLHWNEAGYSFWKSTAIQAGFSSLFASFHATTAI